MKKTVFSQILVPVLLFSVFQTAFAASGDIAGQYYSTDIRTYLNGAEIDAINVGGQTFISAEDMYYYSFRVFWYPEERELAVDSVPHAVNGAPPAVQKPGLPSGAVLGDYYETDIVTYLDGKPITAYNTGGRTYIHAEAMRNFGYQVEWSAAERSLRIVSPDRAGYIYSIPLSFGNRQQTEGCGSFSVTYTKDGITAAGDADYFRSNFSGNADGYSFTMGFYQNGGLYYSSALLDKLRPLASSGYGVETPCDPAEKYDPVNQTIEISVNGQKAEKVEVLSGAGNGHRDFTFLVRDLPRYTRDEISEISIRVGEPEGELYEIVPPEDSADSVMAIAETLKKYPDDFMQTYYPTEKFDVIYLCESKSLGVIRDRIYLVNRETGTVSEDILEQVRQIDGFGAEVLNPFAFSVRDNKNNLFFSCAPGDRTGDFYVELDTGTVHLLAQNAW